jgi:hypothetical protein
MHEGADATGMSDFIKFLIQIAADEKIAGKQRLDDADNAATGWPVQAQTGMENFEAKIALQVGGRNMLMLRLRPHAKPSLILNRLDI